MLQTVQMCKALIKCSNANKIFEHRKHVNLPEMISLVFGREFVLTACLVGPYVSPLTRSVLQKVFRFISVMQML